jgi:hypothetical protein
MQTIEIQQSVKGALTVEYGYYVIASTPTEAVIPANFEEKNSLLYLSKDYASLLVFRAENVSALSAIHIQGQYTGNNDRVYDNRIFYSIDTENLQKCSFKIGSVAGSLPKMRQYDSFKRRALSSALNIQDIQNVDKQTVENLRSLIIQAIAEEKRIFIKLDNPQGWRENRVLENIESRTVFAAIDALPEILRPVASFALSVDGKLHIDVLRLMLIVLYHGDRSDIKLPQGIELNWHDLKNMPKTDSVKQEIENTIFAQISIKNGANSGNNNSFFDTKWSSRQMLNAIKETRDKPETKRDKHFLEYLLEYGTLQEKTEAFISLWDISDNEKKRKLLDIDLFLTVEDDIRKLYSNDKIKQRIYNLLCDDLDTKAKNGSLDLSDIYTVFKYSLKDKIVEKYTELYCREKSSLSTAEQIETVEKILHNRIIEKKLQDSLFKKLIKQILDSNFAEKDWIKIADLPLDDENTKYFIAKTAKKDLSFFEKILKSSKHKQIAVDSFKESSAYKNNDDGICKEPFVEYLSPDKKQELRKSRVNNIANYKELFAGITYAEISRLPVDFKQKIKLLSKEDYSAFIRDNSAECEKQFEYEFFNYQDIREGEFYKLYEEAEEPFPTIDDSNVTRDNLRNAFNNAQLLNINLTGGISELYKRCEKVNEVNEIYNITRQKPDEAIMQKLTVVSENELYICAEFQKEGFTLPRVDVSGLINNTVRIKNLLDTLKNLNIPFDEHRLLIERKLSKLNKKRKQEFLAEYFEPTTTDNQFPKKQSVSRALKKDFRFNRKAIIIFIIGFIIGFLTRSLIEKKSVQNNTVQQYDTIVQPNTKVQQPVKNNPEISDVVIYYRKAIYVKENGTNVFSKCDTNVLTKKITPDITLDSAYIIMDKLKPIVFDSILLGNSTILLSDTVDGPISLGLFVRKLDSIINNKHK